MRINDMTVLLTGGAGGIGRAIAAELLDYGASVLLVGRGAQTLNAARNELAQHEDRVATFAADITDPVQRGQLCDRALRWRGGINALINNAGVCNFAAFDEQPATQIDAALSVNVQAPMHLCWTLLPHFRRAPAAAIVNVGSVYGSIGYPGYAVYSATKFALRGFTEALRRELFATNVSVHYLAPRATSTNMNSPAVDRMNAELRVTVDPPQQVARQLRRMLTKQRPSAVIGAPESLFVRVNALAPGMIDKAIRKQLPAILRYAANDTVSSRETDPLAH